MKLSLRDIKECGKKKKFQHTLERKEKSNGEKSKF